MSRKYEIHCDGPVCARSIESSDIPGSPLVRRGERLVARTRISAEALGAKNGWRLGRHPDELDFCPGCQKPEPS